MRNIVLAKSCRDPNNPLTHETLLGHSRMVKDSFLTLFEKEGRPSRFGKKWLSFFQVNDDDWPVFRKHGLMAAWLHDIGKANSSFQKAVRTPGTKQALRHEHFSGLLLSLEPIRNWLGKELQHELVLAAIVGHHLRFSFESFCEPGLLDSFECCADGAVSLFNCAAASQNMASLDDTFVCPVRWSFLDNAGTECVSSHAQGVARALRCYHKSIRRNPSQARMLRMVRAALLLADSVGSAIPREDMNIEDWLADVFSSSQLISEIELNDKVITPRLRHISNAGHFRWNTFQEAADTLSDRALLMTPCGSGKTLAAWRWIASRLRAHEATRVIFLYPTRGTAAEGFRDYVSWAPESDAALISGTSRFDLEGMFTSPEDVRMGREYLADDRLYALGYWPRRIFSATVDQFLGFMQNVYRSICLLPLLADSVLVIDEVHSFDKGLFSALKRFLSEFDLPVLCMTASLPSNRVEELRSIGMEIFPQKGMNACFTDLEQRANKKRYRVDIVDGPDDALLRVKAAAASGLRVLWVVNTTERCRQYARLLHALCYHSRYRLADRKLRHESVIRAFQQRDNAACAVATQVCEMSLDLDADMLVSEYAPITALIQRMGRCNRRDEPGLERMGAVLLYKADNALPYAKEDMAGVEPFIAEIAGREISQSDLQGLLDKYGPDAYEAEKWQAFMQGGVEARSHEESLRDGVDFTTPCILDAQVEHYLALRRSRDPQAEGMILPVPRKETMADSRLPGFLHVASADHYDALLGYGKEIRKENRG